MELSKIREQSAKAAEQVCEAAKLKIGDLFVVGLLRQVRFWARRLARIPV